MLWLVLGHQADVNARVGELLVAPKTHSPTRRSMKPQLVGDNSEAVGYNSGATAGGSSGALLPRPWCGHLPHGDAHVGALPVTTTTQSLTHTTMKPQLVGDNSEAVGYNFGATAEGSSGALLPRPWCGHPPHDDAHVGELPVTTTTQSHTHTTVKPQLVGDNSEAVGYNSGATAGGSPGELPQRGCSGP